MALSPDGDLCGVDVDESIIDPLLGLVRAGHLGVERPLVFGADVAVGVACMKTKKREEKREILVNQFLCR